MTTRKRTPSGARIRQRRKPVTLSVREVPLLRLVRALTTATADGSIDWDYGEDDATWTGTDGAVTVAWSMTPKGKVKSAAMTVDKRSVHIMVEAAMLDNVRILTPLVQALVTRHQDVIATIVDGLLADIAGPVETVTNGRIEVAAVTGETTTPDVTYTTPRTTPVVIRETPGIRAAIQRMFWRA